MNATHNTKIKRLATALGAAAAAATAPALLFAGAGTAHADDCYDGALTGSFYCSPYNSRPAEPQGPTYGSPAAGNLWDALPGCSGGGLAAILGAMSGEGCT